MKRLALGLALLLVLLVAWRWQTSRAARPGGPVRLESCVHEVEIAQPAPPRELAPVAVGERSSVTRTPSKAAATDDTPGSLVVRVTRTDDDAPVFDELVFVRCLGELSAQYEAARGG